MGSCLRRVSRWFTPLAGGPMALHWNCLELPMSSLDMASKLCTFTVSGKFYIHIYIHTFCLLLVIYIHTHPVVGGRDKS